MGATNLDTSACGAVSKNISMIMRPAADLDFSQYPFDQQRLLLRLSVAISYRI